jgi:putative SOS response-associated peptidase YedK
MCNLYSITTNQAAIIALFRVINRYVGNLPPMPGVFPDYPAPVIPNREIGTEMVTMRWGLPPPPRTVGPPVTNIRNTSSPPQAGEPLLKKPVAKGLRSISVEDRRRQNLPACCG